MRNDRKGKESVSDTMENQKSNTQSDCTIIIKWPVMISSEDKKKMYDEYLKMKEKGLILLTHGESVMLAPDGAKIDVEFERGQEESEDARREEGSAATERRKSVNEKKYTVKEWLNRKIGIRIRGWDDFSRLMDIAEEEDIRWPDGGKPKEPVFTDVEGVIRVFMYKLKGLEPMSVMGYDDHTELEIPVLTLDELGEMETGKDIDLASVPTEKLVEEMKRRKEVSYNFLGSSNAKAVLSMQSEFEIGMRTFLGPTQILIIGKEAKPV